MRNAFLALLLAALLPGVANAWWNKDWSQRTRVTLNTSAQGVATTEAASNVAVAVRLHSGNFDFVAARDDGADLRVVAADDKTPLAFSVERWDPTNELAVLWVQVPLVAPGSDKNQIHVYAGNSKAGAEAAAASGFDAAMLAAIHFSDKTQPGTDHRNALKTAGVITVDPNGLLASSLRLDGRAQVWPGLDAVKIDAGAAATLSLWIKATAPATGTLLEWGAIKISARDGKVVARVGASELGGGDIRPNTWSAVALTLGAGHAALYVDGLPVAQADVATPALAGDLRVGEGLSGSVDEIQIASIRRSADWIRVATAAQGADSKLVASVRENADSADGSSPGYIGILVKNLTVDAWVVIGILGVMFVVAVIVMIGKANFVVRADRANRGFLKRFRDADHQILGLDKGALHADSPMYRLYLAGLRELRKRKVGEATSPPLSGASLNAVKAAVDADMVRETHRLNAQMVLLTIAISGGPFLGLLGTVVGVMITFAAIAAAGDVNVNAIAPGIAAALLATVAGLSVAIPALFGYNYLASRIKNISSDLQIFVDEFITRVAEIHGAP